VGAGVLFFDVDPGGMPNAECRSPTANGETANTWEYCRQWIDRGERMKAEG
ncbi:MAG: hypothetical protein HY318_13525, partial [Armatimonadetes bacterium]|nr:hypothetical protein [Armatimonadota bacterium]